ncbi:MAG: HEPN domain-containing protein [Armatimonadota bacterium]
MRDETRKWLEIADGDFTVAEDLLATGHFSYVAVSCQQSLEKTINALIVEDSGELQPRTHDLLRLAALLGIDCPDKWEQLLADLTALCLGLHSPDRHAPPLSEAEAPELLSATGEVRQWLQSRL